MSLNVAMRFEPTIVNRRSLCGSSHERCKWAEIPEGKRRKQKTTSSTPGRKIGLAASHQLMRLLVDEVQEHRGVVRPEAPQGILVGPHLAQVHTVAVHVVDLTKLTCVGQLL